MRWYRQWDDTDNEMIRQWDDKTMRGQWDDKTMRW